MRQRDFQVLAGRQVGTRGGQRGGRCEVLWPKCLGPQGQTGEQGSSHRSSEGHVEALLLQDPSSPAAEGNWPGPCAPCPLPSALRPLPRGAAETSCPRALTKPQICQSLGPGLQLSELGERHCCPLLIPGLAFCWQEWTWALSMGHGAVRQGHTPRARTEQQRDAEGLRPRRGPLRTRLRMSQVLKEVIRLRRVTRWPIRTDPEDCVRTWGGDAAAPGPRLQPQDRDSGGCLLLKPSGSAVVTAGSSHRVRKVSGMRMVPRSRVPAPTPAPCPLCGPLCLCRSLCLTAPNLLEDLQSEGEDPRTQQHQQGNTEAPLYLTPALSRDP
nr:uncharacterized protein LOC114106566 isoform X2 [Marmota flaviventris]